MGGFLRFVTEQALEGRGGELKETVVGVHVFGREAGYDPKQDPVVRVEARRLRTKLLEYYAGSGAAESVRIDLPKGTYQPAFSRLGAEPAPAPSEPAPTVPSISRRWIWLAIVPALLAIGAIVWMRPNRGEATTPRLVTERQGFARSPSFSPDGQSIAYGLEDAGHYNIWILSLDGSSRRPLTTGPGIEYEPRWSPDGATIAFLRKNAEDRYAVVLRPVSGNRSEKILTTVSARGSFDWMPGSRSLLLSERTEPRSPLAIFLVEIADGRRRQVTAPPAGSPGDTVPRASPDGRQVAFVRATESAVHDIWVAPVEGGEPRRLTHAKGRVEGLVWHPKEASILASLQPGSELRSLWRVGLDGSAPTRVPEAGVGPIQIAISPSGDRLAWADRFADTNVWSAPLPFREGSALAITSGLALDTGPQFSPDSSKIAWRSARSGRDEVWISDANGQNPRRLTYMNGPTTGSAHWSPDASSIVFDSRPSGNGDLFVIDSAGGKPRQLTRDPSNEVLPSFSRDGHWIYFSSDRSGVQEIWKMRTDGTGAVRVAGNGAFYATESFDAKWVYFTHQTTGGVWRIPVQGGAEEKVLAEPPGSQWGQWSLTPEAIYYLSYAPPDRHHIMRYALKTKKTTEVLRVPRFPVHYDSAMSAAANEAAVTWAQLDSAGSEIMLIEGFR